MSSHNQHAVGDGGGRHVQRIVLESCAQLACARACNGQSALAHVGAKGKRVAFMCAAQSHGVQEDSIKNLLRCTCCLSIGCESCYCPVTFICSLKLGSPRIISVEDRFCYA
eukprot:2663179-Amphidinium_carterae.1